MTRKCNRWNRPIRIGCAVVALLLLVSGPAFPNYIAVLNGTLPTTISLSNPAVNTLPAAATILFIVQSSGKKSADHFETLTARVGDTVFLPVTFTPGTVRMVIECAKPNEVNVSSVTLSLVQTGGATFTLPFDTDTTFTFDVQ